MVTGVIPVQVRCCLPGIRALLIMSALKSFVLLPFRQTTAAHLTAGVATSFGAGLLTSHPLTERFHSRPGTKIPDDVLTHRNLDAYLSSAESYWRVSTFWAYWVAKPCHRDRSQSDRALTFVAFSAV